MVVEALLYAQNKWSNAPPAPGSMRSLLPPLVLQRADQLGGDIEGKAV